MSDPFSNWLSIESSEVSRTLICHKYVRSQNHSWLRNSMRCLATGRRDLLDSLDIHTDLRRSVLQLILILVLVGAMYARRLTTESAEQLEMHNLNLRCSSESTCGSFTNRIHCFIIITAVLGCMLKQIHRPACRSKFSAELVGC
jgi:hypothetical protein